MLTVFIENEAGSDIKHHYDEVALTLVRTEQVNGPYVYPYGFIPGTIAPDGDAADCFVITDRPRRSGTLIQVEPIALLEQTEGGHTDNNVISVIPGEPIPDLEELRAQMEPALLQIFAGMPGREVTVGRMLGLDAALAYLAACSIEE